MLPPSGKIVTFYSYKGGTGRSMALANVAWVLASAGARVLVVDWDLEAPGLHRYFRPFLADKDLVRDESEGLIDFMIDFAGRMATPQPREAPLDEHWYEKHADISKWSKQLLWPSGEDAQTRLGGTIHFVPAGRQGAAYAKRVNSFDWSSFYRKYSGGAFIDAVRRSMLRYDWVLIDSRTGVSDTSGICTMQLPDTLVVCFTLNYQSIDGAAAVAASARDGRRNGLRILPLPTRLDGSEDKLLRAMLAYARDQFDPLMDPAVDRSAYWRAMGIPYFPRYAFSEKLAPFEEQVSDTTSTLPAVERLTAQITEGRISRLEPLPEPHRAEALAEFEQMPGTEYASESPASGQVAAYRVPLPLRRSWYLARQNVGEAVAVALLIGLVVFQLWPTSQAGPSEAAIPSIADDAIAELAAGRRSQAALLLAEAAGRLDPAIVVGPDTEPGGRIYEALLQLSPLVVQTEPKESVQISPDGRWLATTGPQRETSLFRFPPQDKEAGRSMGYSVAAFSPDSRYMATGGRDGSLIVVETETGRRIWQWENPDPDSAWVTAVAFSPNGNLVAAGTDSGTVVVAQVDPWKELKQFVQPGGVDLLAFSPDSLYIASGGHETDRVTWWSPVSDKAVEIFPGHSGGVAAMVFAPPPPQVTARTQARSIASPAQTGRLAPRRQSDGERRMVTAGRDGRTRLWIQTGGLPRTMDLAEPATVLAFSPAGDVLATGGRSDVLSLWKLDPQITAAGSIPAGSLKTVTFSADGLSLVTGNALGEIVNWFWNGRRMMGRAKVPGAITSVALGPDSRYIAFASVDGARILLPQHGAGEASERDAQAPSFEATFSAAQVKGFACSQADQPQLSAEDWKKYFRDEPLRVTCGEPVKRAP